MTGDTTSNVPPSDHPPDEPRRGVLAWWHRTPLYARIFTAMVLGVAAGLALGPSAAGLKPVSDMVLRLLRALVIPLIFVAVIHSLLNAEINGRTGRRLIVLLATNTAMAIFIGLVVVNVVRPGRFRHLERPAEAVTAQPFRPVDEFLNKVPESVVGSLAGNDVIRVVLLALAFGLALRRVRDTMRAEGNDGYLVVEKGLDTAFRVLMVTLHWVIDIVPFAVFSVVANVVGTRGFKPFVSLGLFVVSVLLALSLQALFYLARVRLSSWVRPMDLMRGGSDAIFTAFSTASSTATMPITYNCMRNKVGVREESASMGTLVGANFNNDGTALYEAMAPMFIAQSLGDPLGIGRQVTLAFMSVVASVGAPGIPEAGLVTMLLVFTAVGLPVEFVPLLLTVDWFLDRCRTAVNVMGDMCVSSVLDGPHPEGAPEA